MGLFFSGRNKLATPIANFATKGSPLWVRDRVASISNRAARFVWSRSGAPRAYWKGYLKLSLVSCPVALFPASSEREKISFNQINKKTGNRIRYRKVDAETGDEVDSSDIIKGYEVGKGQYIEFEPEELEAIAIESKRTIEIDEFVPKKEIDELYLNSPYYLVPDGEAGQPAFAVIREAIRKEGMVALGRVVFTSREHVITLEARGKGLLGNTISRLSPKSLRLSPLRANAQLTFADFVALNDIGGIDLVAGLRIDLPIPDAVTGLLIDLIEADFLAL